MKSNLGFKRLYIKYLPIFLIIFGIVVVFYPFFFVIKDEVWYQYKSLMHKVYKIRFSNEIGKTEPTKDSVFSKFLAQPAALTPVNTDFSLVIEKIALNVPVVSGVLVSDPKSYNESLKQGVAMALVSDFPSKHAGNTYIFAHSSLNFFQLGKYATAFNLLRKLEPKDVVYVFYHNKAYKYEVVNKEVFPGFNTYPLTRPVLEPILTLQTCDPPGTTLNRLVVTAKLVEVRELE